MNGNRKRKQQPSPPPPKRPIKAIKGLVEDIYPFDVPNIQKISPQMKLYINELQRQYIERYNILLGNRTIYSQITQSMSTELDGKGIAQQNLMKICQSVQIRESNQKQE